jgi:hypothetical protein
MWAQQITINKRSKGASGGDRGPGVYFDSYVSRALPSGETVTRLRIEPGELGSESGCGGRPAFDSCGRYGARFMQFYG